MHKGQHLLIDCQNVSREACLDDRRWLEAMAEGARRAGATVISQIRYQFGQGSPAGCTAIVMLDESHCSVHTYADLGLVAMDVFTCGATDPRDIWEFVRAEMGIEKSTLRNVHRFGTGAASSGKALCDQGAYVDVFQVPQERRIP